MASAQAFRRFPHEKIIKKCPPSELSTSGFWTMHNFCCERKHGFHENTLRGWSSKTHFYGFQMLPKRETWIVLVGKNSGKSVFHEKCVVLHFRNITYRSKSSHLFSRIQIFVKMKLFRKVLVGQFPKVKKIMCFHEKELKKGVNFWMHRFGDIRITFDRLSHIRTDLFHWSIAS